MPQPNTATYCIAQIQKVIHKKNTQKPEFLKQCQMQTIQQKNKNKIIENQRRLDSFRTE